MSERTRKIRNATSRSRRTRTHIRATAGRPRLSVFLSNTTVSAQIIDDEAGTTLASARSKGRGSSETMTERAAQIGEEIAKAAKKAKVTQVVLDRGSKKYHGRLKSLADAARKNGLEF